MSSIGNYKVNLESHSEIYLKAKAKAYDCAVQFGLESTQYKNAIKVMQDAYILMPKPFLFIVKNQLNRIKWLLMKR